MQIGIILSSPNPQPERPASYFYLLLFLFIKIVYSLFCYSIIFSIGISFGLNFLSLHKRQRFAMATPCSRLLSSNLRVPQTSLRVLEHLLLPMLLSTLLYNYIRGNVFTENSTSSNILLYLKFFVLFPTLVPVQAAVMPTSAQFLSLSAAATPSLNLSSISFATNYSTSHELISTSPSGVLRTAGSIEPSTVSFNFKSQATDTSVSSVKKTVPHWYKQGNQSDFQHCLLSQFNVNLFL